MALYPAFLGNNFDRLAPALQDLHKGQSALWRGEAKASTGTNPVAQLVRRIVGFPDAADKMTVTVSIDARDQAETWQRHFDGRPFHSVLSWQPDDGEGYVSERFGPMRFLLHIPVYPDGSLAMIVQKGWCFGLLMPRFLLPISETREFQDSEGRFNFDVRISLPLVGHMVHYRGWLMRVKD